MKARDGIEAQRGFNDAWPGDEYPGPPGTTVTIPAAQHAALMEAARTLRLAFRLPRPWMDGGITWVQWDEACDKIDASISALKAAGIDMEGTNG